MTMPPGRLPPVNPDQETSALARLVLETIRACMMGRTMSNAQVLGALEMCRHNITEELINRRLLPKGIE